LYTEALKLQQEQGRRAEYLIFADYDAELFADSETTSPYALLHAALGNVQPAVAAVAFKGWHEERNRCGPRAPCAPDIDASFNAFHRTAASMLLPYDTTFEGTCWAASQAILIELMLASMPEHVVQFNHLFVRNEVHSSYPRSDSVYQKPEFGFSEVALYLRKHVNGCLRERIGLESIGGLGAKCHSCQKTSACAVSAECFANDTSYGKTVNYMDVVACKPYA
jgi:hypothetical protein